MTENKLGKKTQAIKQRKLCEEEIISGNFYDKFNTRNPIAQYLVKRFLMSMSKLVNLSGAGELHEVGCGEGNLSILWAKEGKHVLASDISTAIIKKAKENAKREGVDVNFKVADIYDLNPVKDSSELIICCEVLEHLSEPKSALSVLSRLASPYCLLSVPREPIWRILNIARGKYLQDLGNTPGHLQHWTQKEFIALLAIFFDIVGICSPIPWTMVLCKKYESTI